MRSRPLASTVIRPPSDRTVRCFLTASAGHIEGDRSTERSSCPETREAAQSPGGWGQQVHGMHFEFASACVSPIAIPSGIIINAVPNGIMSSGAVMLDFCSRIVHIFQMTLDLQPGQRLARGVSRHLLTHGFVSIEEFVPTRGLRVDVMGLGPKGELWVIECKSSRADFLSDSKWQGYLEWCDRFFWAVDTDFPDRAAADGNRPYHCRCL